MPTESKCASCRAPVIWAESAKTGRNMILDAVPVPDGNTVIMDGKAHVITGELFEEVPADMPRYRTHWATCPQAKEWRTRTDEKNAKKAARGK